MKNSILLYFLFLHFSFSSIAASRCISDTIPPSIVEEYIAEKEAPSPTMTEEEAEYTLLKAKDHTRRARNALIFTIPTAGIFYIFALIWLISALNLSIKARRYYSVFSKDEAKIKESDRVYQSALALLIIHIIALTSVFLFMTGLGLNLLQSLSSFNNIRHVALLGIILMGVTDFFFFNIFIQKPWLKKRKKQS